MPLCGFNKTMINGLKEFFDGLYVQALKRAQDEKVPVLEVLGMEVEEMSGFKEALESKNNPKLDSTLGLALLARGIYRETKEKCAREEDFNRVYDQVVDENLEFFWSMDDEYYKKLRPSLSIPEALSKLGDWCDKNKK